MKKTPRWILDTSDPYNTKIQDQEHGLNLAVLCESGFGLTTDARALGQRICDWLNSLPEEETLLYPYNLPWNRKPKEPSKS
jgi:hypothetical protein